MSVNPTQQQLEALAAIPVQERDRPLVMLNLNRYRERARYEREPPGGASPEVSGREAYERYGAVALAVLGRVGAQVIWSTRATLTLVGEQQERFDEVIAVRYPGASAFLELAADEQILRASAHREAGLERALVIRCDDDAAWALPDPTQHEHDGPEGRRG